MINGRDLQQDIIPLLESKGFKVVKPDIEISLSGECFYQKEDEPYNVPEAIFEEDWKKIIEHNEKRDEERVKEFKERKEILNQDK